MEVKTMTGLLRLFIDALSEDIVDAIRTKARVL